MSQIDLDILDAAGGIRQVPPEADARQLLRRQAPALAA